MRQLEKRISLLEFLGELFRDISSEEPVKYQPQTGQLRDKLGVISRSNPWFTEESILMALSTWGETLTTEAISDWRSKYTIPRSGRNPKLVNVIMAGNIPLVGFHDFICTVLSGHYFFGKLSSRDNLLFPLILKWILEWDPAWKAYIEFGSALPEEPDIIIATGSNNTSRLISGKYAGRPMIIRHNRSSIGLLTGSESPSDLDKLAGDILWYYGLGCRNLSLLYIPPGYDLQKLSRIIQDADMDLPKPYHNNLLYQRVKADIHRTQYIDAGKLLLINKADLNSPLGNPLHILSKQE